MERTSLIADEDTRLVVTVESGELHVAHQRRWKGEWVTFGYITPAEGPALQSDFQPSRPLVPTDEEHAQAIVSDGPPEGEDPFGEETPGWTDDPRSEQEANYRGIV